MLKFNEYSLITENFNQMKSLFVKNSGQELTDIIINANSDEYKLLQVLIGTDNKYTKLCTDPKIQATYGDNIKINEEKERSMRSYLGMFTKMYYEENCSLDTIKSIVYYILANKATINKLPVKNNITGETQILSNLLDIFKFKDSIKASGDNRPAYEIITDAIRDKDKSSVVLDFINLMPGILRKEFRNNDDTYNKLSDLLNTFQTLNDDIKSSIHKTFFGNNETTGKISRYKTSEHFLKDFETMILNSSDDFNIDIIKNKILNTRGAILIECNYEHNYIIADIWSYKASNILGEPSSWCISYDDDSSYWFNSYMGLDYERKMYFIWNFNILTTNQLSKLGANINNDGSVNLVCDKNDISVNETRFLDYLNDYNIDKSFLKKKITKAEETFRTNDKVYQNLFNENMFENITSSNIKTELPKILKIMKSKGIITSPKLLSDAVSVKVVRLVPEEIYFIINKFIDTFGVSVDYANDLFTMLLIMLVREDCVITNEIYKLYKRLGNNINYELLDGNFYINIKHKLKNDLPKLYTLISNHAKNTFYENGRYSQIFFETITLEQLDNDFDAFFNMGVISHFTNRIFQKVVNDGREIKTKNNFLQKLNDIGCDFTSIRSGKSSLQKISGFYTTNYDYKLNYKEVLDSISYIYEDDENNSLKKMLILNKNNIDNVIENTPDYFFKNNIVRFYNKFGMDISELNFYDDIESYKDTSIYKTNIESYFKCIIDKKITFNEYTTNPFYQDLFDNNYYENYKEYIDKIIENKTVVLNNKKYMSLSKNIITQNIQLVKKMVTNDLYNKYILYHSVTTNDQELINLCLPKIVETIEHNDIVKEYINTDTIPNNVKDYLIDNIDISSCEMSSFTSINDAHYFNILLDKNIKHEDDLLSHLICGGYFREYNQETIDIVDKLAHTGFKKKRYSDDTKYYLNDLNMMKYILKNIPDSIDTLKQYDGEKYTNKLLSTCDIEKIKYYKSLGLISYPNLNFLGTTYELKLDINTINCLIDNNISVYGDDVTEYNDLLKICRDLETFKYFFNKYKDDMDYNTITRIVLYNLKDTYTTRTMIPGVLEYLKSIIPDTLKQIVMNHYDANKRKKEYSDTTREWIKNNYYTKQKVKKIREMFEIFQNLVKY